MKYYARADGTRSRAVQFEGTAEGPEEVLWLITFLNDQEMFTNWVDEVTTDEWFENEDGEPEQVVIPEHLKIIREFGINDDGSRMELGVDQCYLGDYVVERDGAYYVMNKDIFEAIYEEVEI